MITGLARFLENLCGSNLVNETEENLNKKEFDKHILLPSIALVSNPLEWWKLFNSQFPTLSVLAMKYLCIPATSVPSERIFSCAGNVITDHRSLLSLGHAEELIFFII